MARDGSTAVDFFDRASAGWTSRYATDSSFASRIDRILAAADPLPAAPLRVLDFGCGSGDLSAVLLSRGCSVAGLDVSERMLEQAAARTGLSRTSDLARIDPADPRLPYPPATFMLCIASSVLEYVPDAGATLGEIARVLAPEGRLVATVPDPAHPVRVREARLASAIRFPLVAPLLKKTRMAERVAYLEISKNRFALAHWIELAERAGLRAVTRNPDTHPLALLVAEKP